MFSRTFATLCCLIMLAACSDTKSLEALRAEPVVGDAYQQALAKNYKAYAEELAEHYEWGMTRYFADKGLAVARGRIVEPEEAEAWSFPNPPKDALEEKRARLIKALELSKSTQPEVAASALVGYDRWLSLNHFSWDPALVGEAETVLDALITKLEEAHTASNIEDIPPPSVPSELNRTVLYFPFDSARLGDSALSALAELARSIPEADDVAIAINGHADRAGPEAYNMKLSERRAKFVLEELERAGVPGKRMSHYAFGETDPAVPTADGVAEPKNRRVEITVE